MKLTRVGPVIAAGAALCLALAGCGGATVDDEGGGEKGGGFVNIAINPWVGYEASAAVVAHLLDKELGYKVQKKTLKEEVAWQGFESGEVDVIIENWGHPDLKKKYIDEKKVATVAGSTGNKGVIGWYVPSWMETRYPGITDWKNLNKYAGVFRTSESGDKGQLLFGDPSYVSNEKALITNLKLDYKVVVGGSEATLIKSAQQSEAQQKPLLFYFWDPHWLFSKIKLSRVKLPPYKEGCDADPKKVACDYPEMDLDKIVSTKFRDSGGKAYQLVKNFSWTNEDQNGVANDMTNNSMTAEQAAEKWVNANKARWQAWIPK
ncbi:ABC transporter substrate-binding protein [Spirillospora sp. NPDC047279]|uniref:ABC transporter substrate-binding protein n=1 Tax=Spirillospora sp. NPDC047279 TaxID=3155478 RepID=UPI003404BB81